jgi:hypothetical protein
VRHPNLEGELPVVSKKTGLVLAGTLMSASLVGVWSGPAMASSHREAPAISQDPQADNTDLYTFRDTADPTKLNIVANYIGLEDPNGGPNFIRFSDDVQYSIHVDNNGDAADDITYNFRFRTAVTNPNTFLYNTGQVTSPTDSDLSVRQTYSVEKVSAAGSQILASNALVPPVNVGVRSNPQASYESTTAQPTIAPLVGGGKVFAGSRADPFFVDLGSIFDLGALRPIQSNHLIPLPNSNGVNSLSGKNVHTIALQVPISSVTAGGITPTTVDSKSSVVGVYASTARQRVRVLSVDGSSAPRNAGRWVQVSRLGIPLVNEVLIPMGKKDRWNSTDPKDDGAAGFFANILDPEFTKLLPVLYPGVFSNSNIPAGGAANRPDLVALVTGRLAGLSAANALPPADLLRINLASPAGAGTAFPNGRQLADDVVDTEIQVLAGVFLDNDGIINKLNGTPNDPGTGVPYSALKDGVNAPDAPLLGTFPYVGTPYNGFTQRICNNPALTCPAP